MTTLKCCVIDDEPLAAQLIASYVKRTPSLELAGEFSSAQEAFAMISSGAVDLVFLDIQMPQLSGMEFAKLIPSSTMVVFTTAYENYAIQGFKVNAVDYLLKPVSYEEFLGAVGRAHHRAADRTATSGDDTASLSGGCNPDESHIIVKSEYRLRQIAKDDILFIEGLKDYVKIYIEGEERPVMTLLSLKSLEGNLSEDKFMRVHRSFIINLSKINTIERGTIRIGSYEVPVSDSYRPQLNTYVNRLSVTNL